MTCKQIGQSEGGGASERDEWMKVGGCRERDRALAGMERAGRAKSLIIALQGSESVQRKVLHALKRIMLNQSSERMRWSESGES